jgi:hypothetical protein
LIDATKYSDPRNLLEIEREGPNLNVVCRGLSCGAFKEPANITKIIRKQINIVRESDHVRCSAGC